jgi:hypothetical protein
MAGAHNTRTFMNFLQPRNFSADFERPFHIIQNVNRSEIYQNALYATLITNSTNYIYKLRHQMLLGSGLYGPWG